MLEEVKRDVDRVIDQPLPDAEVLHDLHRELRRLAGGLSLWNELLPSSRAEELRPAIAKVRRFARLVGRVRDRDVTLSLVEPLLDGPVPPEEDEDLRKFAGRLREDARTGRELLRAFLTTERHAHWLEELRAALDHPLRTSAPRDLERLVHDAWATHRRKLRRAHRRARRKPNARRLHRLRIRIRRWRHLASLAELARVAPPEPVDARLSGLQERLGHLHDLDVALASFPDELATSSVAARIRGLRRDERRAISSAIELRERARKAARAPPRPGPTRRGGR